VNWDYKGVNTDAHFSYVCSHLAMNRGAFNAENHQGPNLSAPLSGDERDSERADQMKIPRLYEAHLGFLVLQSAQTST
jgi:hypothetical protein